MTKYICKCGREVYKSTNATNTGNRDTDGCQGCPYILPYGQMKWNGKDFSPEIEGYECRMSKDLEYGSRFSGSVTDKKTCYIVSLDFEFLTHISTWIAETYPDREIFGSFSVKTIRSVEYVSNGRYRMAITCTQNKKGIAAKAALLHHFFDESGARLDMTPEQEKAKILAAIDTGKDAARQKEDKEEYMDITKHTEDFGIMTAAGELLENGTECRRRAASRARAGEGKVQAIHVCDDQPQGIKIWLNASCPGEYWVMNKTGEICGEHIESCPYCKANLKIGCGDVLLVPYDKQLDTKNNAAPFESGCLCITCTCTGCHEECFGHCNACGDPTTDCNSYQTGGKKWLMNSIPKNTDQQQIKSNDLPEVCKNCQCLTCGNEDCATRCWENEKEVNDCEITSPAGVNCKDYKPKKGNQYQKEPAQNQDALSVSVFPADAKPASFSAKDRETKAKEEIDIFESTVRAFKNYCIEKKLEYQLCLDGYPVAITVYKSNNFGQIKGQLAFSLEQQPGQEDGVPCCTWTFAGGDIMCTTQNNWSMDEKIMTRLKNHAKKIECSYLRQFFAVQTLGLGGDRL